MAESFANSSLLMDRGIPLGNSEDTFGRRALHTKVANDVTEPIPVTGSFTASPGGFAPPANTDAMQASYPDSVTEVYQYYLGGLAGTLLQTITVVYSSASKETVLTVVKT